LRILVANTPGGAVQLEKKLFENRESAHTELEQRDVLLEHGEDHLAERLPDSHIEAIRSADKEGRAQLLGALRMVLDRERLDISQLRMPPRESRALEALRSAVEGKDERNEFIYASDRRDLLERALGVLQPDLMHTDRETARELHAQFADLTERVALLRDELGDLEDAQDELLEPHEKAALEALAAGDKPAPKPPAKPPTVPSDPEAAKPPTSLTGPDVPEKKPVPTTLTGGPDPSEKKPAPTTLTGPDVPENKPAPTTLTGPDVPENKPAPTTLTGGPDVPEAAPPPSTLGDGSPPEPEVPGDKKRSWWRRPFG
jgi:hypothetical protein